MLSSATDFVKKQSALIRYQKGHHRIGPLQPFLTVAADGYEVLHRLGQVFILVVYQAEMALEFKIWQGELDEAARFDFVLDQGGGTRRRAPGWP